MKEKKEVIFKGLSISTTRPISFVKDLEKLLRKYGQQDWCFNFKVQG